VSVEDATEDYDVLGAEVDEQDASEEWDTNELARGQGDDEQPPLEEEDDVGEDIEQAVEEEGEDEDEEPPEDDGPEDDDEEEDEEDEEDEEEDELGAIDLPTNWPAEVREHFAQLPPPLQHWLFDSNRRMTADYTRKTQEVAQVRQAYQELDRVIAPHAQTWALQGMSPATAIQQLVALSDFATSNPTGFIQYFANQRGVDLSKLGQPESTDYVDPQVAAVRQQVAQVQAYLNQTVQQQAQQQQAAQAANYQRAFVNTNAAIDNFASQTGPDGKPAYPFFGMLEEDMAVLIEGGRAKTVHEAYELAKWANPITRSKLLARQRNAENARARRETREARTAASSLSGASSAYGSPATEDMSIRDLITGSMEGNL
jgi:hypothetical protein